MWIEFGLLPLSFQRFFEILLFVLLQQPGRTGRPAASQGNLLVAGIASYLLPLLPARMHHLPDPPPPVPQMPSYWQWLNVARLRVASHLLCSLRGCVYLLFISCCLHLSSPTWHGGAGQCRYHIWFRAARLERSPSLLCFAARQLRRWLPSFQTWNNIKNFYSTSALYVSCLPLCPPVWLSIHLSVRLSCLSFASLLLLLLFL